MAWHALHYPLRPGTEDTVAALFAESGRPSFDVLDEGGAPVGRLLGTMAFVGAGKALRVMDVEGSLPQVAAHMSRQPAVREFERRLEDLLAAPRDMRSPEGARAFFKDAALGCVQSHVGTGVDTSTNWVGVFYPLRPGHEAAVTDLVAAATPPAPAAGGGEGPRITGMLMFVGRQKALRLVRTASATPELLDRMSRDPAARAFQQGLEEHLDADRTGTPDEMARFFADATVRCVLARRHDRAA